MHAYTEYNLSRQRTKAGLTEPATGYVCIPCSDWARPNTADFVCNRPVLH